MNYPFATIDDLINYLGLPDASSLPSDIDRIIKRASELIYRKTRHLTDTSDKESEITQATCAQIEYWLQIDETSDITGPLGPMKIEDFSFNSKFGKLGPRCKEILIDTGLMYKGVSGSGRYNLEGKDVI
jgi:hypothetical protein